MSQPAAPGEGYLFAADQLAVSAQERLRADGERRSAGAGAPAQGGKDQSVARALGDPLRAASQDAHFVASGEVLEVSGGAAPAAEQGEVQEQPVDSIQERC
jgi:hypothetical protein